MVVGNRRDMMLMNRSGSKNTTFFYSEMCVFHYEAANKTISFNKQNGAFVAP
jgi:hypothetical protein